MAMFCILLHFEHICPRNSKYIQGKYIYTVGESVGAGVGLVVGELVGAGVGDGFLFPFK